MDKNLRAYLAELIGTFILVFLGAGCVIVNQAALASGKPAPGLAGIALANGLAYAVALAVTLPFSNGFLNPAITLMLWVFKRLDTPRLVGLIFVQLLGAVLAGGLLRLAFTEIDLEGARMGTPHLNPHSFDVGGRWSLLVSGVPIELGLTFVITFVIFATVIDPRTPRLLGPWGRWLAGFWPGLALVAMTLAAYPWTGAAANPARWCGTVVWEQSVPALAMQEPYRDQMVYWFGPAFGALLAGAVYIPLLLPAQDDVHHGPAPTSGAKSAAGAGATLFRTRK